MADDEVVALRRDVSLWRKEMNERLDVIHNAVMGLAGRAYVPGPSVWKRLAVWVGLVKLG